MEAREISTVATPETSLRELFPTGQIRLDKLTTLNWGVFRDFRDVNVPSDGALLTGDNGAGKTTVVDAYMTLFIRSDRAKFNAAASNEKSDNRSIVSYMRGDHGSTRYGSETVSKCIDKNAVQSTIKARFKTDSGEYITLMAIFWIASSSRKAEDVGKLYVVAHGDLSIDDIKQFDYTKKKQFSGYLKSKLGKDNVWDFKEFSRYETSMKKILCIENMNAPALLARALGLKKVDDLTKLVRELVLEPSSINELMKEAILEFDDLVEIDSEISRAQDQLERLLKVRALFKKWSETGANIENQRILLNSIPQFVAELSIGWLNHKIEVLNHEQREINIEIEQSSNSTQISEKKVSQLSSLFSTKGGDKVKTLEKDISSITSTINDRQEDLGKLVEKLSFIGLERKIEFSNLPSLLLKLEDKRAQIVSNKETLESKRDLAIHQHESLKKELADIRSDLAITMSKQSNIPGLYLQVRDRLCEAMNMTDKEVIFIGELINIRPEHSMWQGAIEKALGGRRLTLAVPHEKRKGILTWVHKHSLGLNISIETVIDTNGVATFLSKSYLRKIEYRQHPYREWLKQYLSKYDLDCVESVDEMMTKSRALTINGLMNHSKTHFRKNDRYAVQDRNHWFCGFDNNERMRVLKSQEEAVENQIESIRSERKVLTQEVQLLEQYLYNCNDLIETNWVKYDCAELEKQREEIDNQLTEILSGKDELRSIKFRLDKAKSEVKSYNDKIRELDVRKALCTKNINEYSDKLDKDKKLANIGLNEQQRELLESNLDKGFSFVKYDEFQSYKERSEKKTYKKLSQLQEELNKHHKDISSLIIRFQENHKGVSQDWSTEPQHLIEPMEFLEKLEQDGLPALKKEFKDRLNLHATQSISSILEAYSSERESIKEKIDTINCVIKRCEFKEGTFLCLKAEREKITTVSDFEKAMRKVLSMSLEQDHNKRFNAIQGVINTMTGALEKPKNNDSRSLLDPRYQMFFYADELSKDDSATIVDTMDDSQVKSGGEKEAFAGTIVAASLAYALTPDGSDKPIFSTVFLDEAFSNTAETLSRRVLGVFRELKLHVNLLTPFKNINLAREFASSVIIAQRIKNTNTSKITTVSWEEAEKQKVLFEQLVKDKKKLENAKSKLIAHNERV